MGILPSVLRGSLSNMNKCPNCQSIFGIREVIYGMPEEPMDESKFLTGGCCVSERDPTLICVECTWEGGFVNNIDHLTFGV
jgi:hypothetical protein